MWGVRSVRGTESRGLCACRTCFSEQRQKSLFIHLSVRLRLSLRQLLGPNKVVRQKHTSAQLFVMIPVSFGRGRQFCSSWLEEKAATESEACSSTCPTPVQPETPLESDGESLLATQNKSGSGFCRSLCSWFQSQGPQFFHHLIFFSFYPLKVILSNNMYKL